MSKNTWILIGVLVLVALGAGAWYYWQNVPAAHELLEASETSNELPTSPKDTSDAALEQDAAAIDAQLKGLDTDSVNTKASLTESASVQ